MSNSANKHYENEQQIPDDELLRYVQNKMSDSEKHAIELHLQENAFLQDAVDGLQQNEGGRTQEHVEELNQFLSRKLRQKKPRGQKKIKYLGLIALAVILLLLVVLGSYMVLHQLKF